MRISPEALLSWAGVKGHDPTRPVLVEDETPGQTDGRRRSREAETGPRVCPCVSLRLTGTPVPLG